MARGRSTPIVLDDGQKETLTRISEAKTEEPRRVRRATILLMASNGEGDDKIAEAVGLNKNSVRNTISKFNSMGIQAALADLARKGRPANIGDEDKAWLKGQASVRPREFGYPGESWTIKNLTEHIHATCKEAGHGSLSAIASSKVWKVLSEDGLRPHGSPYYLERRDPGLEGKSNDILMVYKEMDLALKEVTNIGTVPYGEEPGKRAIENTAPDPSPTKKDGFAGREPGHGKPWAVSLLAGLNLITGEVTALVRESRKSSDFVDFLRMVDARHEPALQIRIALDNHSANASKETRKYLESRPGRFEFVFRPRHGSWLNLVESFFDKFARVCLSGMAVNSKEESIERIYRYIAEINEVPVVCHWKYEIEDAIL